MILDNMKLKHRDMSQKGFALFIAIGVTSILLLVSMALVNVSLKQTLIASSSRESQRAFYAADNGIECVLYWETINPAPIGTPGESPFDPFGGQNIVCNGQTFLVGGGGSSDLTSEFTLNFDDGTCAVVEVTKDGTATKIESRGRNSCDTSNTRRVERGVRVQYGS